MDNLYIISDYRIRRIISKLLKQRLLSEIDIYDSQVEIV